MDDFTSAFLTRGKSDLRDVENVESFTPFGISLSETGSNNANVVEPQQTSEKSGEITEPETIKKWRHEFTAGIEKRDNLELKKDEQLKESAKKELTEWTSWYKNNTIKSQQQNRMHEEELQAGRDKAALMSETQLSKVNPNDAAMWERICQLCDLSIPSTGDIVTPESFTRSSTVTGSLTLISTPPKDVARFRSLLLSLKNNPPKLNR